MGERYAVLPLQAPHIERNNGSFGRRNRRNKIYNGKRPKNKQRDNKIKEDVKQVLLDKYEKTSRWTDEQKDGIKNTLKAQLSVYADMILKQAEDDCYNKTYKENKSISVENEQEIFYQKLHNTAIDIAENQFAIDPSFDIEEAIRREKEILEKVKNGKITAYEAKSYLEEPLMYKGKIDYKYKQYVDLYNKFTTRGQQKIKPEEVEDKTNEQSNTKNTNQSEEKSIKSDTEKQTKNEDDKEYLNIKTVRRDGNKEAGLLKGSFINFGIGIRRLILKTYEKIPKVFRDSLEELAKNGFSGKWKYLLTGAVIASKLEDSREEKLEDEKRDFHQRVEVPHYDRPHHGGPHHDGPHHGGPHHEEVNNDDLYGER